MSQQLSQKFVTEDGKQFDTRQEAVDYLRRPHMTKAFNSLNNDNGDLTNWLIENQENIESIFESTKVQRVTKSEKKQLEKALEAIKASEDKQFDFVIKNADAILNSFRWPAVKRANEEEQNAIILAKFLELTSKNEELSNWLLTNKDAILDGYEAGVVKREINPKATEALAQYRAKKAAEKAAAAPAEAPKTE